jgi:hypothetical protein
MTIRSTLAVAAVSGAALLGGCAVAPYDNGYGYNQGYGYNGYGNGYSNGYNGYGYAPGYYDPGYVAPSVEFGVQYSDRGDRRQWRDRDRWHDDRDNDRRREWHGDRDGRHD